MTQPLDSAPFDRAKQLARENRTPVYVSGDEVSLSRPKGRFLTVWPNGTVTMGSAANAERDLERRHVPPAA